MAKIRSCGFLIYRREPELSFLLMKHAERWDLPKGHVDSGETKVEAAFRELFEETGIRSDDVQRVTGFKYKQKYKVPGKRYGQTGELRKTLIIYLAELVKPVEIKLEEHLGYEWFPWNPPHNIQEKTINPLLAEVDRFWKESETENLANRP